MRGDTMIRIEIECPYCGKVHVHNIPTPPEPKAKVEEDVVLPHDDETDDLENFREEDP